MYNRELTKIFLIFSEIVKFDFNSQTDIILIQSKQNPTIFTSFSPILRVIASGFRETQVLEIFKTKGYTGVEQLYARRFAFKFLPDQLFILQLSLNEYGYLMIER
jgi:hypothetical protein